MEIKYLEWNLHAMGGRGYEIPKFVVNYLKTADVFVLTEFCQTKGWEDFQYALESVLKQAVIQKKSNMNI